MSLKSQIQAIIEGKRKQADIKSDKELTKAGASSSSDPKSKRYSPSLHTMHNAPENVKRRKHSVVIRRSDRSNERHAKEGEDRRIAIRAAADKRASELPKDHPRYRPLKGRK